MFGFVVGLACLWGLVRVIRGGRCYGGACGGGWRSRRWGGPPWKRGWDDDRGGFWLRGVFERLDTSPGQEKEIKKAVNEVKDAASALKDDLHATRQDVANAFKSDSFDADSMAELLTRHDGKLDELRRAVVGGLARIHAALDEEQRQELARVLSRRGRWHGGPYRSHA